MLRFQRLRPNPDTLGIHAVTRCLRRREWTRFTMDIITDIAIGDIFENRCRRRIIRENSIRRGIRRRLHRNRPRRLLQKWTFRLE